MKKKVKFDISLKVGDKVEWGSQANGNYQKKEGKVLMVIPAGVKPYTAMLEAGVNLDYITHAIDPRTLPRKMETYIIEVPAKGKGMPRLYWPLISNLQRVE